MTDRARVLDRLVMLLGMTGSEHDGEAVAAVRKANDLLKANDLTWADVIAEPNTKPPGYTFGPFAGKPPRGSPTVEEIRRDLEIEAEKILVPQARARLDDVLARGVADIRKREHFESIRESHQRTGYINPAHRAQIDRAFFKSGWDRPFSLRPARRIEDVGEP